MEVPQGEPFRGCGHRDGSGNSASPRGGAAETAQTQQERNGSAVGTAKTGEGTEQERREDFQTRRTNSRLPPNERQETRSARHKKRGPEHLRPSRWRNALRYPRNESRIPAATAEPTTPATFGPMACISR